MGLTAAYGRCAGDPGGLTAAYDGGGMLTPYGGRLGGVYGGGRECEPTGQVLTMHQDFINSMSLAEAQRRGPVLTHTRGGAAVATRFNSSGVLETMGVDVPRFDHAVNDGIPLGILIEFDTIQRLLWNRDFTDIVWDKTNITAVKDATGLDAVANSASTLTATAANGTALQTVTIAAADRTFSVYVKRKTGTGDIDITQDGGSTWTTLTGLSATDWTRHKLTASILNPDIGFRIVTDTDAIEVDYSQFETGAKFSSPIKSEGSLPTRLRDILKTTDMGWYGAVIPATMFMRASVLDLDGSTTVYSVSDGSNDNRWLQLVSVSGRAQWVLISTRGASVVNTTGSIDWVPGVEKKLIWSVDDNDTTMYEGGSLVGVDVSCSIPEGITAFNLGSDPANSGQFGGHIKEFKYWNVLKTAAFLQAITA